jgi:TonB family protein
MSDRRPCIRCGRTIDAYAKSCVFCNWDQTQSPSSATAEPAAATVVAAPLVAPEQVWKKRLMLAGALAALAIIAFAIGAFVHREEKRPMPEAAKEGVTTSTQAADTHSPRADVTLVPVSETAAFDPPVTSAPAPTTTDGTNTALAQRNDATALPASEYAAVAERAKAERAANRALVDPRSISGTAYSNGAPARPRPVAPRTAAAPATNAPMASSSAPPPAAAARRTAPVPEYQPLPSIYVDRTMTARLRLTVGADGRVKDINIDDAIPGQTPKLISAVQSWRFRPATQNGVPVEAPFSVDISFHGNE